MVPQTTAKTIATIKPKEWSGRPAKGAGKLFFGSGFLTFIVCMFLLIPIPPLRSVGPVIMVCTLAALAVTIGKIVFTTRRELRALARKTVAINEFIVESTGDESNWITVDRFRLLVDHSGKLPEPRAKIVSTLAHGSVKGSAADAGGTVSVKAARAAVNAAAVK